MKKLKTLNVEELKTLKKIVSQYDSMEDLKNDLDNTISCREKEKTESLNIKFNMDMFIKLNIFSPFELNIIESNNISNLQELIDCNLDDLVGITPSVKRNLEWARSFYDMSFFDRGQKKI